MPTYKQQSREKCEDTERNKISFECLSSVFSGYHCRKHLPLLLVLSLDMLLLFYGIVSKVAILCSVSDHLLLLYYSATYFYILLLYPVTLPISFIFIVFWPNIWGFLCMQSCHLKTMRDWQLIFQFDVYFLFCLEALARTSVL